MGQLLNLGEQGPLDLAQANSKQDGNQLNMSKINSKIDKYSQAIAQKEKELQMLNSHASKTASNMGGQFGGRSTGYDLLGPGSQTYNQKFYPSQSFRNGSSVQDKERKEPKT
mmetsp:Transcript_3472/g.5908  ORF Transcript_3472/g.5908 Transcript_3472/m.5908 type:complete len:112 (-) Transcript_3472:308-643(-)